MVDPRSPPTGGHLKQASELGVITAEQARSVLNLLISEGRVAARDVAKALRRRKTLVEDLRRGLAALGEGLIANSPFPAGQRRKRKAAISPKQRRARHAQGRYLGAIARLSKTDRAKIRAVREKHGVEKAIAAAKRLP